MLVFALVNFKARNASELFLGFTVMVIIIIEQKIKMLPYNIGRITNTNQTKEMMIGLKNSMMSH